jgi:hypothetical protein
MRDSSPRGNVMETSTNMNLGPGVEGTEGGLLVKRIRSCGQVTVAFCKEMVISCSSCGGTGETSGPSRYFSIRRKETMLYSSWIRNLEQVSQATPYLENVDYGLWYCVQSELHLVKDFSNLRWAMKMNTAELTH